MRRLSFLACIAALGLRIKFTYAASPPHRKKAI